MNRWRAVPATFWHLLVVTMLGLPLLAPLWRWTAVPCTHDGHLHVHRVAAMRHAWESGLYFTRWLPDLALGYGYPFFVYREPAPLYAMLWPHLLGLPLPAASNLFYALSILAAGWFTFLWVKDVSGSRAGIVSAVAYMAAPYILLDALVRGNAPESLALPLLPLLLWSGRRWMKHGSAVPFATSLLGLALLTLSHNISTLIFVPSLLVYLVAVGRLQRLPWRQLWGRLALLLVLGLGLTLFYTGSALLEMGEVTLAQSTTTRNNDFHFNFATWSEVLAPVTPEDPSLLNPPLPIRLGWVPGLLALLGAGTLWWKRGLDREQRAHVWLMAAAAALYLFMALPLSLSLWENAPLIEFVQFPWRFVGRAALPVAFLAGAPFAAGAAPRPARRDWKIFSALALPAAVLLLLVEALPALYPRYCEETLFPGIEDVHAYELASGLIGVDPEGSYFPRTVERRPQESPLLEDYSAGRPPQRWDMSRLPAGATAQVAYRPLAAVVELQTPAPFTARYLTFAFPGWQATIDGQLVPITPEEPSGLITFPVPAGAHEIAVRWRSTPLRTALGVASVLALAGAIVATVLLSRPRSAATHEERMTSVTWPLLGAVAVIGLLVLAFKILAVDRGLTPLQSSDRPALAGGQTLSAAELRFDGYRLSQERVDAGYTFDINLAWTSLAPTLNEYQSSVWLEGPGGLVWSDKETHRPRLYEDAPPTWERAPGQWAWDSHEVRVLPGTPPGEYALVMTLFDLQSLQPLTLSSAAGAVLGPTAVIGQITVEAPTEAPALRPQFSSDVSLPGQGVILRGFNQDRATAAPGEQLLLTLFWERDQGPLGGEVRLALRDESDALVEEWPLPIAPAYYDPATWEPGQILRGQYLLRLPVGLPSGRYLFVLADSLPLEAVDVISPQRILERPPVDHALDIAFAGQATLEGYSLRYPDPATLVLDLLWRARQESEVDYHVFVHLLDEHGEIVAQSDGQPAGWTRPTTSWLPGEYILDTHTLPLPDGASAGKLQLRVGLYDPQSGARLPAGDNDSALLSLGE